MIYALSPDNTHIMEEEECIFDAVLIGFEGSSDVLFFHPEVDDQKCFSAPEVIEFTGNLENAAWLDHIETSPTKFLLISKKMVHVLEGVKPFRHRLIPTVIYSGKIEQRVRNRYSGRRTRYQVRDPELRNDEFVILQLLDQIDCLDRDRTIVDGVPFRSSGKKYLGKEAADHLELVPPEGGFPPVFFVPELLYYCFTEEAKQACDNAGLKGLRWRPQQ